MKKMLQESEIDIHFGASPLEKVFFRAPVKLVFLSGEKGIAIAAHETCLVDFDAEISFDMVGRLSKDWWDYWREYWDAKKTATPWETDLLCETVVPSNP